MMRVALPLGLRDPPLILRARALRAHAALSEVIVRRNAKDLHKDKQFGQKALHPFAEGNISLHILTSEMKAVGGAICGSMIMLLRNL